MAEVELEWAQFVYLFNRVEAMMDYRNARLGAGSLLIMLSLCTLVGCAWRSSNACKPAGGMSAMQVGDDLAVRPLYSFNEAELDTYLRKVHDRIPGLKNRIVHLGRKNIGQPYELYLLGEFPFGEHDDDPIYYLGRSDCVTFSEHTFACALSRGFWEYLRVLQRLRYKDGVVGMVTRNHYTVADWDINNRYLFEDVTGKLGRGAVCVPLNQVCRRASFFSKYGIQCDIPDQRVVDTYIPKENLPSVLGELKNGDFVNIIRGNKRSQYAGHVGLVALAEDGTVDFLHSTPPSVREQPIMEYLNSSDRHLGVKILRMRDDAERIMRDVLAESTQATVIDDASLERALDQRWLDAPSLAKPQHLGWPDAMRLQSYRIGWNGSVDSELQSFLCDKDSEIGTLLGIPESERAFGVLDMTDLRLAMVRPDTMFYAASVPKICVLLAYFETHPEAVQNLPEDVRSELGQMIKVSDNGMAAKYGKQIGIEKVQEVLQSRPYFFYDKDKGGGFWYGKHYSSDSERIGDPVHDYSHGATVRQCLRFYLMLEQGRLVSPAASALMKEIFAAPKLELSQGKFVAGLKGRDVVVIRKSGTWNGWFADTARVEHKGRVYAIAGLTHHDKGNEYLKLMAAAIDEYLCGEDRPAQAYKHEQVSVESEQCVFEGNGASSPTIVTSPILQPTIRFNEAVLSWNVDCPEGAGFAVEMRVREAAGMPWSPWLHVGEWGERLPEDPTTEFDGGLIDVDYFKSDKRYKQLQVRVCGCAESEDKRVAVRSLNGCVSDTTGVVSSLPRPEKPAGNCGRSGITCSLDVPF